MTTTKTKPAGTMDFQRDEAFSFLWVHQLDRYGKSNYTGLAISNGRGGYWMGGGKCPPWIVYTAKNRDNCQDSTTQVLLGGFQTQKEAKAFVTELAGRKVEALKWEDR